MRFHCAEADPVCCSKGKTGWVRYLQLGALTELKSLKEAKRKENPSTMHMLFWPSEQVILLHMCATLTNLFLSNFVSARCIYFLASLMQVWSQRTWHPECFRKPQILQKLVSWPWLKQENKYILSSFGIEISLKICE